MRPKSAGDLSDVALAVKAHRKLSDSVGMARFRAYSSGVFPAVAVGLFVGV